MFGSKKIAAIFVLLAAAALIVGLIPLRAPPLLDDLDEISHVATVSSSADLLRADCYGLWRPVKNLVFAALRHVGTPMVHIFSAALFVAALALACRWFKSLGLSEGWALAGAAIWVFSPTMVSSVAWLSTVNILVMLCASLAALLCWSSPPPARRIAGLAFFLLALAAYEGAIALPALWLIVEFVRQPSDFRLSKTPRMIIPMAAAAAAYLIARRFLSGASPLQNESFDPALPPLHLSAASAWFFFEHFTLWLWPFGKQGVLGGFIWHGGAPWILRLCACWIGLLVLVVAAFTLRRRRPLAAIGIFWFVAALFPMSNFIPLHSGPVADYFLPLPGLGLALAATDAMRWLAESPGHFRRAIFSLLVLWRVATAALCLDWAQTWTSENMLLERSVASQPEPFRAMTSLARAYCAAGRMEDASRLIEQSREKAPWFSQTLPVRGQLAMASHRFEEAKKIFAQASNVRPHDAYPPASLGFIADEIDHDATAAKKFYREALSRRWSENSVTAANNLAALLAQEGDPTGARAVMEFALTRTGENAKLLRNLAVACKQAGDTAAAQMYFERFLAAQKKQDTAP